MYVKYASGPYDASCGSNSNPCKDLQTALDKSFGDVVIVGTMTINQTVNVTRSVTIRSAEDGEQATVKGKGMSKETAFALVEETIDVNITGIKFIDIGIINIKYQYLSNISINSCYVTGTIWNVFLFDVTTSRITYTSLAVVNTNFTNIKGSVIYEPRTEIPPLKLSVNFVNSRFVNITCSIASSDSDYGYVFFHSLSFHRCTFINAVDVGSRYYCEIVDATGSHNVDIINVHTTN